MWRRQWSSARRVRFGLLRSVTAWTLDKPPFIIVLLHNLGTHIDPRVLVERIEGLHSVLCVVLCTNPDNMQDLVVLNCRHTYHIACLQGTTECSVCCKTGKYKTNTTYYYKE